MEEEKDPSNIPEMRRLGGSTDWFPFHLSRRCCRDYDAIIVYLVTAPYRIPVAMATYSSKGKAKYYIYRSLCLQRKSWQEVSAPYYISLHVIDF
jgi:hypothetical protein